MADRHGINFKGALIWAFTFQEQPYFAGFRQLASCGIPRPFFNVFRMLGKMSGDPLSVHSTAGVSQDDILQDGVRGDPEVAACASHDALAKRFAVLIWHYLDDDLPGPEANVTLELAGLPDNVRVADLKHYRIGQYHSNAYATWRRMGSPVAPNLQQYESLQAASHLATLTDAPATIRVHQGQAGMTFPLPRQAVSLGVLNGE